MTNTKTKRARRPAGSLNALQSALGLTKRQISTLLSRGMPDGVAEALAWRKSQLGTVGDSAETLRQRRIALLEQQERRARLAADEAEKLLVPKAQAEAEALHDGLAVKGCLLALEASLTGSLLGLQTHGQIRAVLHREFHAVLGCLSDGTFHRAAGTLEIIRKYYPGYTPESEAERPR